MDFEPGHLSRRIRRLLDRPGLSEDHRDELTYLLPEVHNDPIFVYQAIERILDEMGVPK